MPTRLSDDEIPERIADLAGWTFEEGGLEQTFRFGDFVTAFGFMTSAAIIAEKMNHHPEWSNVYARVTVRLTTHDVGGLSELDVELASHMSELAGRLGAS